MTRLLARAPTVGAASGRPVETRPAMPRAIGALVGLIRKYHTVAISVLAFSILVAAWYLAARAINIPALFPTPLDVWLKAVTLIESGELQEHVLISFARVLVGWSMGSVIAIVVGLLMGNVRFIRVFLEAYLEFFRYVPSLSMVTLAMIWFGIGEASKYFLIIYGTVFIVTLNTIAGIVSIPSAKLRAARALGANQLQIFVYVTLPASIPFILTGMRIAMGTAFTTIVAAEMVSAQSGLGFLIFSSRNFMQTDAIFVGIISLGILGFLTDRVMRFLIVTFGKRYSPQL